MFKPTHVLTGQTDAKPRGVVLAFVKVTRNSQRIRLTREAVRALEAAGIPMLDAEARTVRNWGPSASDALLMGRWQSVFAHCYGNPITNLLHAWAFALTLCPDNKAWVRANL